MLPLSIAWVLLALLCTNNAAAFMNLAPIMLGSNRLVTSLSQSSTGEEGAGEYTVTEVQAMDSLIISMSLEPTDNSRRQRLASVFSEELAKADCRRFAYLFDHVLTIVGDRVQVEAKTKALAHNKDAEDSGDQDDENDDGGDFMGMGRSPEEKQLWALVDMMVQSKTIAKKAFNELGNKGTLQ
jgi:hypothetical protein